MPPNNHADELRIEAQKHLDFAESCRMWRCLASIDGSEAARLGLPTGYYRDKWRMFARKEAMHREMGEALMEEARRLEAGDAAE